MSFGFDDECHNCGRHHTECSCLSFIEKLIFGACVVVLVKIGFLIIWAAS